MPSQKFPAVDCPLCPHPHLWNGTEKCPGCHDLPSRGHGKISQFKLPGLYTQYPELARIDTVKEMAAVKPEEPRE
jgi:hypothetical protein